MIQNALEQDKVCWLWSQSAAYGLLMGMDLKTARYVDKSRKSYLMDKHDLYYSLALEAYIEYQKK